MTGQTNMTGQRIAKVMAHAGLCSRREAERWIEDGRVKVNGICITSPALTVTPQDRVEVDGTPLASPDRPRLWLYHKPRGLITTHHDPQGRPTVFEHLPPELPRVISIGRLDLNTEGLLLLTNDGTIARHLELPSTGWVRRYRVRVFGGLDMKKLEVLKQGITIDGIHYAPADITLEHKTGRNAWLQMAITEGKNREIRNILSHFELAVNRLIRVSYGPFELGNLLPGKVKEVTFNKVKSLSLKIEE